MAKQKLKTTDEHIDQMIKDGLLVEHEDGTIEATEKGIKMAEDEKKRLEQLKMLMEAENKGEFRS